MFSLKKESYDGSGRKVIDILSILRILSWISLIILAVNIYIGTGIKSLLFAVWVFLVPIGLVGSLFTLCMLIVWLFNIEKGLYRMNNFLIRNFE